MSPVKLDLAKFKKVGSDGKSTTMRHADGHQLVLSHSSLDKKKLEALDALPLLAQENKLPNGVKHFKDGGETTPEDVTIENSAPLEVEAIEPEKPVAPTPAPAAVEKPQPTLAPTPAAEAIKEPEPEQPQQQPAEEAPKPALTPSVGVAQPAQAPVQQSVPLTPEQAFAKDKSDSVMSIAKENTALAYDLSNDHITPKTYADLFAKKDTLGKIGTVFGLLLGGAGSGLTGTQNPLTAAWDKIISNDIDAQKTDITNKQTLLRMNRDRFPDTESAINFTRMQANILALHDLRKSVDKLPLGSPARAQAQKSLEMVGQFVDTNLYNLTDQIAAKQAFMGSLQGQGTDEESTFQAEQKRLRMSGNPALVKMADVNEERRIPGIPGRASRAIPQETRDEVVAMDVLDHKVSDILDFAKAHKGTLSPSQKAIGAQKAEELINFYNKSIQGGVLTEGRLAWLDSQIKKNPASIFQDILGNNSRLREIQSSNNQRRSTLLKSLGFPAQKGGGQSSAGSSSAADSGEIVRKAPNGRNAVFDQNKKFLRWQ